MARAKRLQVFEAVNGWYFRLVHANGRKGDRSAQPYVSSWSAKRGARRAHPGLDVEVVA